MQRAVCVFGVALAIFFPLAGCTVGRGGEEVRVTGTEYRFESSRDTFTAGTPYRFVVRNAGSVEHEWMVMPRGEHDESKSLVSVEHDDLGPGRTATREFTFPSAGQFEFACHLPGHYDAGMVLAITVN